MNWVMKFLSKLPNGYTEIEYLENNNNSCIDTGFTPNYNTRIVVDAQMVTSTNYGRIFGCGEYNKTDGLMLDFETSINGNLCVKYYGKTEWTTYSTISNAAVRRTYDLNKNECYVDGSLVGSYSLTSHTSKYNIGLFNYIKDTGSWSTDIAEFFKGKIYSCKIYDNGVIVRDFVPCYNSSNVYGMYDIINKKFYSSASSTAFTGGAAV